MRDVLPDIPRNSGRPASVWKGSVGHYGRGAVSGKRGSPIRHLLQIAAAVPFASLLNSCLFLSARGADPRRGAG